MTSYSSAFAIAIQLHFDRRRHGGGGRSYVDVFDGDRRCTDDNAASRFRDGDADGDVGWFVFAACARRVAAVRKEVLAVDGVLVGCAAAASQMSAASEPRSGSRNQRAGSSTKLRSCRDQVKAPGLTATA